MRTSAPNHVDVLRALPIFGGCSERELARIATTVHEITLEPGEVLVAEHEPASTTYVITSGVATVAANGVVINEVGAGELCGEMGVLDGEPRCATVTAVTKLRALGLPSKEFAALVEQPWMARRVLRTMVGRLRNAEGATND